MASAYQSPSLKRDVNLPDEHDSERRSSNKDGVRNELRRRVDPNGKPAGNDAHQDRTAGEEDDHGQRSEDAVNCSDPHGPVNVEAGTAPKAPKAEAIGTVGGRVEAVAKTATAEAAKELCLGADYAA